MSSQLKQSNRKSHKVLWTILIVALVLAAIAFYYLYRTTNQINYDNSKDNEITINETEENQVTFPTKGFRSIVLFGVDSRENNLVNGTRSDTIIILNLDYSAKEVKLCPIYRDTYVNIPNSGYTKINHAYAKGGYSLALSTINTNFDLGIKEYVTVNFYAVTKVIDLLGGITLDIKPEELKWLNGYIRENNRVNHTSVPGLTEAGTQTVNGTQALAYARIRYTKGGDYKRTERQRIVIHKVFEKAKSASISTLLSIVNEMLPEISTNIKSSEILALAKDLSSYTIVDNTGFPFQKTASKLNGVSYVFPINVTQNVTELHSYLYPELSYTPSSVVTQYDEYIKSLGY